MYRCILSNIVSLMHSSILKYTSRAIIHKPCLKSLILLRSSLGLQQCLSSQSHTKRSMALPNYHQPMFNLMSLLLKRSGKVGAMLNSCLLGKMKGKKSFRLQLQLLLVTGQ
jgi:hypothetical protein